MPAERAADTRATAGVGLLECEEVEDDFDAPLLPLLSGGVGGLVEKSRRPAADQGLGLPCCFDKALL